MVFGVGLVVLTSPVHHAVQRFGSLLPQVANQVNQVLYVQLVPREYLNM